MTSNAQPAPVYDVEREARRLAFLDAWGLPAFHQHDHLPAFGARFCPTCDAVSECLESFGFYDEEGDVI